jgi:GH3 auxin-responsive promoter
MSRVGRLLLWTKAPRAVRRFTTVSRAPGQAQERLPREILRANADSEFGRRHGFAGITTFRQFQQRVPIASYEDLEPYITAAMNGQPAQLTKDPPMLFTTTSGTTGTRKYIPMTREGKRAKSRLTGCGSAACTVTTPASSAAGSSASSAPRSSRTPPTAPPAVRNPGTPIAPCPDPSARCTPHPTGCSPSRTTRPSTTRCCGWPPGRTSALSRRSTPARSCCWPTGWAATPSRSSVTLATVHCPRTSPFHKPCGARCICAPIPSAPDGWSGQPQAATARCGPAWRGRS